MATEESKPAHSGDTIGGLVAFGVILLACGAVLAGLTWPGEDVIPATPSEVLAGGSGTIETVGSLPAAIAGAVLAAVGLVLLNVGLTAWAVSLGTRNAAGR